jgi:hypothetical protein
VLRISTGRRNIRRSVTVAGLTLVALFAAGSIQRVGAQRKVQVLRGESIAPVYDGYEENADGTYSMWFGYFNRNHEEELEIPVGPDNRFEPGPEDRGQPTHFVPEWQKSTFRVIVPKNFGDQKLVWRLTVRGKPEVVTATLNPRSIIDRKETTIEGTVGLNRAPAVTIEPATQSLERTATASLRVTATDDGLPVNTRTKKPQGLTVRWRKYRGPQNGRVTFEPATALLVEGKSMTIARFSEPGEYVVQGVVDDGSLFAGTYCCWVSREVTVSVK